MSNLSPENVSEPSGWGQVASRFFGIIVVIAIVFLLYGLVAGHPSLPFIQGHGGNQNPFVGIANSGIFAGNAILMTGGLLILGGVLLVFALWVVIHNNKFKNYLAIPVAMAALLFLSTSDFAVFLVRKFVGPFWWVVPALALGALVVKRKTKIIELMRISDWPADRRWLDIYLGYLFVALFFSLLAFANILEYAWARTISILVGGVFRIGLFAFAIYSLRSLRLAWVRNFHVSINGAAAIASILHFAAGLGWGGFVLHGALGQISLKIFGAFTVPIGASALFYSIPSIVVSLPALALAVYWSIRWAKQRSPM